MPPTTSSTHVVVAAGASTAGTARSRCHEFARSRPHYAVMTVRMRGLSHARHHACVADVSHTLRITGTDAAFSRPAPAAFLMPAASRRASPITEMTAGRRAALVPRPFCRFDIKRQRRSHMIIDATRHAGSFSTRAQCRCTARSDILHKDS